MRSVKRCLVLLPFLAVLLMSHNTFAIQYNSWINIQDSSRTNLDNDYVVHNTANAGSYGFANTTSLNTKVLSASANLSSQVTGGYFNASGDVFLHIPSSLEGGVNCSNIDVAEIVPENVSFNVSSSTMSSCVESIPNSYFHLYTIHIATSGSISSGSPSSFYISLQNTNNQPFISLVGTPEDSPRVFVSADINFSLSSSPELEAIGEINQNIVVISDQIEDLSSDMNSNTESIINNQNENTEAIIKSNQHCYTSPNIIYDIKLQSSNIIRFYFHKEDLTSNTITFSTALNVSTLSNSVKLVADNVNLGTLGTISGSPNETIVRTFTLTNQQMSAVAASSDTFIEIYKQNAGFSLPSWAQLENGSTATQYQPYGEVCKNINEEYYDEQRQADQNISNQTPSDISGSDNQVTTNLIGIITSFVTELSSFSPTDCNLTLPFPSFLGGDTSVNICQGKDVLGNFITLFSTLTVVLFYIPLAWVLLKMIYNEIRSWTNG